MTYSESIVAAFEDYQHLGFQPVAIKAGDKRPVGNDWTTRTFSVRDFVEGAGIGLKLGDVSGGLVDVDLDCAEAVAAWTFCRPYDDMWRFDRNSPDSAHVLFRCPGIKTTTFKDACGNMLLEVRANKINPKDDSDLCGFQTVMPPTLHASGEARRWKSRDGALPSIGPDVLSRCASRTAAMALLIGHYPKQGDRHHFALEVRGFLAHGGWEDDEISEFVEQVAITAGDDEVVDRSKSSEASKLAQGLAVTGGPTLAKRIGDGNLKKLKEWLNLSRVSIRAKIEDLDMSLVQRLAKTYVYVVDQEVFANLETLQRFSASQLDAMHLSEMVGKGKPSQKLLRFPELRLVSALDYAPGEQRLFHRERDALPRLNLFKRPPIAPTEGDVSLMLEHFEYLIPDSRYREWLLNYLAWVIQRPGEKAAFFPLVIGKPGTGKSYVAQMLKMVLGEENVVVVSPERLQDRFNGWMVGKLVVVLDELERGSWRFYNILKPLVTQPSLLVEEKGRNQYSVPVSFNFLCFSNEEAPMKLTTDDRRIGVYNSRAEPKSESYYLKLFEWSQQSASAILHYFLSRDLTAFNVKAHAIRTEDKMDLARRSLDNATQHILELIESEHPCFAGGLTTVGIVKSLLPPAFKDWTNKKIASQMRAAGMLPLNHIRLLLGGCKVQVFAVDAAAAERFRTASTDQLRAALGVSPNALGSPVALVHSTLKSA